MKIQFTPGEWYAKDGNVISMETGNTLAIIPYYDRDEKELEANSKIMAAAPELIECLNFVLGSFALERCEKFDLKRKCEEAIQKATE